jgi:hypothetical protein
MFAQHHKAIGIFKGERAKQDAFDEREDRGGCANAERQGQNDGERKSRTFAEAPKGEPEIICEAVHEVLLICYSTANGPQRLETIGTISTTDSESMIGQGFNPVGGRKVDGPEIGRRAVKGEGYDEASRGSIFAGHFVLRGDRINADDAAGFDLVSRGIGESDDISGSQRSDGKLDDTAVRVDDNRVAFGSPLAV